MCLPGEKKCFLSVPGTRAPYFSRDHPRLDQDFSEGIVKVKLDGSYCLFTCRIRISRFIMVYFLDLMSALPLLLCFARQLPRQYIMASLLASLRYSAKLDHVKGNVGIYARYDLIEHQINRQMECLLQQERRRRFHLECQIECQITYQMGCQMKMSLKMPINYI